MEIRTWSRKVWAVQFRGVIISTLWNADHKYNHHHGEPAHLMLFTTRKSCRAWCKAKNLQPYNMRNAWKFTPVQVRESVKPIRSRRGRG